MVDAETPRIRAVRVLMVMDAVLLLALGLGFVLRPAVVARVFHFDGLSTGAEFFIGMWGCVFLSLAAGYALAAARPARNVVWVRAGIVRGGLEAAFGLVCVARGVVTWEQARFAVMVGAAVALAYAVWHPRREDGSWNS